MKYRYITDSPQGHGRKQVDISLNLNELELLQSMAQEMHLNIPRTGPTARLRSVAKHLSREMKKAIQELKKAGLIEENGKKYPTDPRSVI